MGRSFAGAVWGSHMHLRRLQPQAATLHHLHLSMVPPRAFLKLYHRSNRGWNDVTCRILPLRHVFDPYCPILTYIVVERGVVTMWIHSGITPDNPFLKVPPKNNQEDQR